MSKDLPESFGDAVRRQAEERLFAEADTVKGAHVELTVDKNLIPATKAFSLARGQLRIAQNPDLDPEGPQGRDEDYLRVRQEEYRQAWNGLLSAARDVVDFMEMEAERGEATF